MVDDSQFIEQKRNLAQTGQSDVPFSSLLTPCSLLHTPSPCSSLLASHFLLFGPCFLLFAPCTVVTDNPNLQTSAVFSQYLFVQFTTHSTGYWYRYLGTSHTVQGPRSLDSGSLKRNSSQDSPTFKSFLEFLEVSCLHACSRSSILISLSAALQQRSLQDVVRCTIHQGMDGILSELLKNI